MGSGDGGAVCWYCGKVVATSTCLVVAAMEGIEGIGFAVSTAGTGGYEWHGTGRERKKSVTVKDLGGGKHIGCRSSNGGRRAWVQQRTGNSGICGKKKREKKSVTRRRPSFSILRWLLAGGP